LDEAHESREHLLKPYSLYGEEKSASRLTQRFAKRLSVQPALLVGRKAGTKAKVGAHGKGETPVPIPNTAVKPLSGYYTWQIKAWENSTVPNYRKRTP
jgi:hypothetical protein